MNIKKVLRKLKFEDLFLYLLRPLGLGSFLLGLLSRWIPLENLRNRVIGRMFCCLNAKHLIFYTTVIILTTRFANFIIINKFYFLEIRKNEKTFKMNLTL